MYCRIINSNMPRKYFSNIMGNYTKIYTLRQIEQWQFMSSFQVFFHKLLKS